MHFKTTFLIVNLFYCFQLHHTDVELDQSSRVLNTMLKRVMQNKFILGCVITFVLIVIVIAIYYKFS